MTPFYRETPLLDPELGIVAAASRRDARIKAAQDKAWSERERILRECAEEIEAAHAEYRAAAARGLCRLQAMEAA